MAETDKCEIRAELLDFDDIEAKPTKWLWEDRFEAKAVNIIEGDQDVGKSTIASYIAAKVMSGGSWPLLPDSVIEAGSVIFLTTEENLGSTIKPRMMAMATETPPQMGCKMKTIIGKQIVHVESGEIKMRMDFENLTEDRKILVDAIKQIGNVRLVIVDPIADFGGSTKENSYVDVRAYLRKLRDIAEENDVTILGLMHLNKDSKKSTAHRGLGSVAWTAFPRTAWLIDRHPDDPERRLITRIKCNNARDPKNVGFRMRNVPMTIGGVATGAPVCDFDAVASQVTAGELLNQDIRFMKGMKLEQAVMWLELYLSDGPALSDEIHKAGKEAGHSQRTLRRAAKNLGVDTEQLKSKVTGKVEACRWSLTSE